MVSNKFSINLGDTNYLIAKRFIKSYKVGRLIPSISEAAERQAILLALARTDGNVAKASEMLGISRPTLYDLMNRLAIR